MKKEDIELIRHYLVTLEKAIITNLNSIIAIKEALIEFQPGFQDTYSLKYESLMRRSKEAAALSEFSSPSTVDQIIRILLDVD